MNKLGVNYDYKIKLNITPTATTATYVEVGEGFSSITESQNENVLQQAYLNDAGYASSEVTGGQTIITLTGNRIIGDAAQDYMFSDAIYNNWGEARKTSIIVMYPDGAIVTCPVTLVNINRGGGDANTGTSASVEIHFNGKPTVVDLSLATLHVGNATLTPTFNYKTLTYSVTVTNATDTVTAAVNNATSAVAVISYRGNVSGMPEISPDLSCTWEGGDDVVITVNNTLNLPGVDRIYTVKVNHS